MDLNSVFSISSHNLSKNPEELAGLLAKAQDGEKLAFGELYDLYFKKIYRFLFYRVSHKEVAEDLAEEVFLKAFTKISSISNPAAFEGWLYQIARNLVIDYYRQKKLAVPLEDVENTLSYESNIVDILNLQQQQKVLMEILKELGAEQQVVIKLKFLEGLENSEIAAIMNKQEGAIRVIQHRAIIRLQELIKKNGSKDKNG